MRMEHWEANPSLIIPVSDWVVPAFAFSTSRKHSVTIRERSTQCVYLAVNWFAGPLLPLSLVRNTVFGILFHSTLTFPLLVVVRVCLSLSQSHWLPRRLVWCVFRRNKVRSQYFDETKKLLNAGMQVPEVSFDGQGPTVGIHQLENEPGGKLQSCL